MFKEGLARFCTTKYTDPTSSNMVRYIQTICLRLGSASVFQEDSLQLKLLMSLQQRQTSPRPYTYTYFCLNSGIMTPPLLILPLQDDVCMHLTNYSINKNSKNFVRDEDTGSKR